METEYFSFVWILLQAHLHVKLIRVLFREYVKLTTSCPPHWLADLIWQTASPFITWNKFDYESPFSK